MSVEKKTTTKSNDMNDEWKILGHYLNYMWNQDRISWQIFSVFTAINAILLSAFVLAISNNSSVVTLLIALIGLITCAIWLMLEMRSNDIMHVFANLVEKLEENMNNRSNTSKEFHIHYQNSDLKNVMSKTPSAKKIMHSYIGIMIILWFIILIVFLTLSWYPYFS